MILFSTGYETIRAFLFFLFLFFIRAEWLSRERWIRVRIDAKWVSKSVGKSVGHEKLETSEFDSVTIESNGPENIQVSRFILSSFEISRRKFVFFSTITRVSSFQINLSLIENRLLLFCNEV